MKWTQRNGQQIDVADMDDNHVQNTINMITRNITPRDLLNTLLLGIQKAREIDNSHSKRYVKPQGDMAQQFNELFPEDDSYDPMDDMSMMDTF